MIWRIILWGSLIWLPYLMYRVLGGEAKFTKNIAVGVTMPFEGREDAEVCQRLAKFKKELGIVCAVLTAAVVPCIFIRSVSLSMTLYLTWADVCIVLPYIPYLRCNRDLKRIKHIASDISIADNGGSESGSGAARHIGVVLCPGDSACAAAAGV